MINREIRKIIAMAKKWELDLGNLDKQIEQAQQRYIEEARTEPRAEGVRYEDGILHISLTNQTQVGIKTELIQGLKGADPSLISRFYLVAQGEAIFWDELDVHLSIPGLVKGVYGTRAWMESLEEERRCQ